MCVCVIYVYIYIRTRRAIYVKYNKGETRAQYYNDFFAGLEFNIIFFFRLYIYIYRAVVAAALYLPTVIIIVQLCYVIII